MFSGKYTAVSDLVISERRKKRKRLKEAFGQISVTYRPCIGHFTLLFIHKHDTCRISVSAVTHDPFDSSCHVTSFLPSVTRITPCTWMILVVLVGKLVSTGGNSYCLTPTASNLLVKELRHG